MRLRNAGKGEESNWEGVYNTTLTVQQYNGGGGYIIQHCQYNGEGVYNTTLSVQWGGGI